MYRSAIILGLYLSFAIAIGASCSPPAPLETYSDDDSTGNTGNTGSSNGGSVSTTGGTGMGGTMLAQGGTGGTLPTNGGASGSAGRAAGGATSGGATGGAGRANTTGGSAGTPAMGGTGNTTTGGATGMAGTTSGSAGTGSSTVSCDTKFTVSASGLVRAPMKGACWSGYASAGAGDSTTFDGGSPSTGMPTSFATCGEGCMLNVAGTIAASDESYAFLGFNVNEMGGTKGTIKPTGTSVKVTFTKTGTFDIRLQISAGNTRWCATATSGTAIPWTSLKTECWGTTGKAYAMEAIDQIQLSIPGKAASATPYDVTLTSVEES
jgi:hypothetical protein